MWKKKLAIKKKNPVPVPVIKRIKFTKNAEETMEALVKKARLSNDPIFEIQKCFEQDTQASVQYQNGYKPIANKELFPSYNNIAVGKNLHKF